MRRDVNATCSTCQFYVPVRGEHPSECRQRPPIPLLVPMMVPIEGSPIMIPNHRNGNSGPQMKQILSAQFPLFSPVPDFWCGHHSEFWTDDVPRAANDVDQAA